MASCLSMTDIFDRLKTALADRCAVEREIVLGGSTQPVNLKNNRQVAIKALVIPIRGRP